MIYPPRPSPGDRVAVVSPSAGLPQVFPEVYELGLRRLREELDLVPVEYPTTRVLGTPPKDRARDLHAAFADPSITAVLATIGGDDQITVLRHLDSALLQANPKPFFGYSDNTNLLNHLWSLGIVGYHGGSVMVHLGRGGRPHPAHLASLRAALFEPGWHELTPPTDWGDEPGDWNDRSLLAVEPSMWPHEGWHWVNADRVVEGRTWGGNLEIISWLLQAGFVPPDDALDGCVLRAKAWNFDRRTDPAQKQEYVRQQREALLRAMREYHPDAMLVFDVDFGHTDPQLIIPNGGDVRLDGPARRIAVRY